MPFACEDDKNASCASLLQQRLDIGDRLTEDVDVKASPAATLKSGDCLI